MTVHGVDFRDTVYTVANIVILINVDHCFVSTIFADIGISYNCQVGRSGCVHTCVFSYACYA